MLSFNLLVSCCRFGVDVVVYSRVGGENSASRQSVSFSKMEILWRNLWWVAEQRLTSIRRGEGGGRNEPTNFVYSGSASMRSDDLLKICLLLESIIIQFIFLHYKLNSFIKHVVLINETIIFVWNMFCDILCLVY